ncbi:MAG: septal ring lytic transglycosylase RlpA family protein [Deltaproteobacteria bacterium]|nr:septal ring lytic transglycosylase RlpA family protein [Deltaproteobacteria bacterium]
MPLSQQGVASWYGPGFHGKKTTSGTVYDQHGMTAAHQTLPLGSSVEVTNLTNGTTVTVLINDRGPFAKGRIIDLSYAAAQAVDMVRPGTAPVRVDVLDTGGYPLTAIPDRLDYTLQVGAFSELGKARELKARLEHRYDRPVAIEPHDGYHRVRLGTFTGYDEAKAYGARLSREGLPVVVVEVWPAVAE